MGSGELIGELSVLDGLGRSADAVAVGPVRALVIPADGFLSFLDDNHRIARLLLQLVARRLRSADARHFEVVSHDVEGRLARRMLDLAHDGRAGLVVVDVTHDDLAGWVGASREAVSRALTRMRHLGWVATGRKKIEILDPSALARRAAT
jgi:CRP-like cAMP-binding protein